MPRPSIGLVKLYLIAGIVLGVVAATLGAAPAWAVAAGVIGPVLPMLAYRFAIGLWSGAWTPSRREEPAGRAEQMSGTEFEDYVARVARAAKLPVIMTPLSGDWGVDLIIGKRPDRLAVQCKRVSRPVGPGAVQEVVAGASMQGCTRTMVITNNEFTPAARTLAQNHGCHLVCGAQLPQLRRLLREATRPVALNSARRAPPPPQGRSPRDPP